MTQKFPPPDPHEQAWLGPTDAQALEGPTAVVAFGSTSAEADRIAECVLDARPGLFIVLAGLD